MRWCTLCLCLSLSLFFIFLADYHDIWNFVFCTHHDSLWCLDVLTSANLSSWPDRKGFRRDVSTMWLLEGLGKGDDILTDWGSTILKASESVKLFRVYVKSCRCWPRVVMLVVLLLRSEIYSPSFSCWSTLCTINFVRLLFVRHFLWVDTRKLKL